jgi:hypothetical protein
MLGGNIVFEDVSECLIYSVACIERLKQLL